MSAKERKWAQMSAKGHKRALPRKNCEQPGLKQPGLGTPKIHVYPHVAQRAKTGGMPITWGFCMTCWSHPLHQHQMDKSIHLPSIWHKIITYEKFLVDVPNSFYFSCSGRGKGESEAPGGRGSGGGSPGGRGAEGPGRCLRRIGDFGGGD